MDFNLDTIKAATEAYCTTSFTAPLVLYTITAIAVTLAAVVVGASIFKTVTRK